MSEVSKMFGETKEGLDVSDAAIDERVDAAEVEVDDTTEVVEEATEEVTEEVSDDTTDTTESTDEDAEDTEEVVPENDGETTEEFVMPDKFSGKSAEDIAESYVELEKLINRKSQESNNEEVQQLREYVNQLYSYIQEQNDTQASGVSPQQYIEHASSGPQNAVESYNAAVAAYQNGSLTRSQVDDVVNATFGVDDEIGRQMSAHWRDTVVDQEISNRVAPIEQERQQSSLQAAASQVEQKHPKAREYGEEIKEILRDKPQLLGDLSTGNLQSGIEEAYFIAIGRDPSKVNAEDKVKAEVLKKEKQNAQVERAQTNESSNEPDKSDSDLVRESVFASREDSELKKLWS